MPNSVCKRSPDTEYNTYRNAHETRLIHEYIPTL